MNDQTTKSRSNSLALKAVSVCMLVIFVVVAACGSALTLYSYAYYGITPFSADFDLYSSYRFQQQIHYSAYAVLHMLQAQGELKETPNLYSLQAEIDHYENLLKPENTNFRYRLVTDDGTVLLTNMTEEEQADESLAFNAIYFTDGLYRCRYWAQSEIFDRNYSGLHYLYDENGVALDMEYINAALFSTEILSDVEEFTLPDFGTLLSSGQVDEGTMNVYSNEEGEEISVLASDDGLLTITWPDDSITVLAEVDAERKLYCLVEGEMTQLNLSLNLSRSDWKGLNYRLEYLYIPVLPKSDLLLGNNIKEFRTLTTYCSVALIAACISVFGAIFCFAYLCKAVGHKRGVEGIYLAWWNRIPYDLYCLLFFAAVTPFLYLILERPALAVCTIAVIALCLLGLLWLLSTITRCKAHQLLYNTVIAGLLRMGRQALSMFTLTWKLWIAFALYFVITLFLFMDFWNRGYAIVLSWLFGLALLVGISLWLLYFRRIQSGAERMASGDLEGHIEADAPFCDLRCMAESLNHSRQGLQQAVANEMRSERLKTELITNVSHDIKTPLTSIVNYVDLLKHAETEQQRQEYLEVLSRQSARLKKLIVDLVEASKASTGNLSLHLQPVSVQEMVNQAAAEYRERMLTLGLTLMMTLPEEPLHVMADGQQLWRVFDNLFGNACKYSLPSTRVYLTVVPEEKNIRFTLKNISRVALNVSADELVERFVRGDSSRHTEGSGLGLNITQSLLELQHGTFELTVDGDLFKVEFSLPRAQPAGPESAPAAAAKPEPTGAVSLHDVQTGTIPLAQIAPVEE